MAFRILFFGIALLGSIEVSAAPSLPAAAVPCAECHGPDGVAAKPGTPHLNGQITEYLVDSVAAFKSGDRPTSVAEHQNIALTDRDLAAAAKFYAAQTKAPRPVQPVDAARVTTAATTYQQRCAKCHVDDGRESDHDAPLMAGQALDYLQAQTEAYVSGKRQFPFLMDEAYHGLSREDLLNVSHYFAAQKMSGAK